MTGIVAGSAAMMGAAIGWWGAVIVTLLVVVMLALRPSRPPLRQSFWVPGELKHSLRRLELFPLSKAIRSEWS
jgi:hypothetical protein